MAVNHAKLSREQGISSPFSRSAQQRAAAHMAALEKHQADNSRNAIGEWGSENRSIVTVSETATHELLLHYTKGFRRRRLPRGGSILILPEYTPPQPKQPNEARIARNAKPHSGVREAERRQVQQARRFFKALNKLPLFDIGNFDNIFDDWDSSKGSQILVADPVGEAGAIQHPKLLQSLAIEAEGLPDGEVAPVMEHIKHSIEDADVHKLDAPVVQILQFDAVEAFANFDETLDDVKSIAEQRGLPWPQLDRYYPISDFVASFCSNQRWAPRGPDDLPPGYIEHMHAHGERGWWEVQEKPSVADPVIKNGEENNANDQ